MNENLNSENQELRADLRAQNLALAMMLGELRHEVHFLRGVILAIASAQGMNVKVEDRTDPASGVKSGVSDYAALLKLAREGLAKEPAGRA